LSAVSGLAHPENKTVGMKAHIEIQIRLNLNKGETLHDVLRQFARDTDGWKFPEKESETYQNHIGGAGGYVVCDAIKGIERALIAIAITKSRPANNFYVANIVPQDCFQLTIDQYNAIGSAFARSFGNWCRRNAGESRVHSSNPIKTLANIIPAEKCREYFERYLRCAIWDSTTIPAHPLDIEKLDVFICALFKYGADVRSDEIERFLIVDRQWKPEDAAWVRTRIDAGLDVLKVNRRF
jgi:hypothetical protein